MSRKKIEIELYKEDICTNLYLVRWDGSKYVYTPVDCDNKFDAELMFSEFLNLCSLKNADSVEDTPLVEVELDDFGILYNQGKMLNFNYTIIIGGDDNYWVHIYQDNHMVYRSQVSHKTASEAEHDLKAQLIRFMK